MKLASNIAGGLLGLLFLVFGLNFFLNFIPMPADPSPADAPHKLFMTALIPTGYFAFIKVIEIIGAVLVAIPKARNFGLLLLGPVIVNILAFHIFQLKGAALFQPPIVPLIVVLAAFLLWSGRSKFAALAN
jgi:putative oxidoreductase